MAANIGQFTCCPTLGRTETAPGYPILRFFDPTDFDFAADNMRVRIRDKYGFWKSLDYMGIVTANKLKQFLTVYIELAGLNQKVITPDNMAWWLDTIEKQYPGKFERDDLEVYLETLYTLYGEGQVKEPIYKPFKYVPEKESFVNLVRDLAGTVGIKTKNLWIYGMIAIGVLAFAGGGYAAFPRLFKKGK